MSSFSIPLQNYIGSTTIPVVIEQAEIRVTAPSKTIYVGETAPVFSAADCNITGLVQGENLKTPPTVAYAEAPDTSKTGSVTVTASGAEVPEGGNYKDRIVYENGTLTITSKPLPPAKYTITVQAGTGGTASASPTSAEKGTKITLNATPDGGYHFKEWQVISGGVTISNNSFTMPAANVTVKAVFERNSNGGGNSGGSGGGGGSSSGGGSSNGNNGSSGGGSTIVARPDETKPDTPTTSQTKPATPDKNGNVAVDNGTVQSAINTAKNDAKKNGNTANGVAVVIPVTPKEGQNSFNVTINAQTLNTLVREKVKRLEINIEGVAVGGMDTKLLKWLDTLSANGDVIFRVKKTDPSGLSKEAKAAIGTRPVYDLSLVYLSGGKETPITDFDGHTIAVRLPYAPAKDEKTGNLYAVYVDGRGRVEWLTKSSYDPDLGTVVFETGHFSIYGIGYKNPAPGNPVTSQAKPATPSHKVKKPSVPEVRSFRAKPGKKKLAFSWKKVPGAAGFQIQISTKKGFKGAKTISVSKSNKAYMKKGLKTKKKYYIRIRAYKTYLDKNKKTKRVYGKWIRISKKTR